MGKDVTRKGAFAAGPGDVAWLLGDACAFGLLLYKGVEYSLLYVEGLFSRAGLAAGMGFVFGMLWLLRWAWARRGHGRVWPWLIVEWLCAGGLCLGLARLSLIQRKTQSFEWLTLEWHKLLANHWLLVRVTPSFALALAVLVALGVWLFLRRRRGWLLLGTAAAIALTFYQCQIMAKQGTIIVYLIMYVFPLILVGVAAISGWPRMGARTLGLAAASLILLWHYIGWMPVIRDHSFQKMPGVQRIYPRTGRASEFPLAFFRDFQVDPGRRHLFTAYGPTSGIVRLDLETGIVKELHTEAELVRYLDLVPERNEFYALDWMNMDMLTLGMDSMKITRRENVYFGKEKLYVPVFYIEDGDRMYATYSERPAVAEYLLRPLRLNRWVRFGDAGLTQFRTGVWKAALDPRQRKLFAEAGMVNLKDEFLIVRVDLESFKVDATAVMPEGGLELTAIPDKRRIIATSFFSRNLYEFDMDTMKRTRVLRGPLSCRNLVYDPARNTLVGTGFLNGELRVLDFDSGKTILATHVGNKAASLFITPDGEDLFLGSSWGIFRVKMDEFMQSAKPRKP